MHKYEFTLIMAGSPELTEELSDALFEAGCDDGSPGTCEGVFSIDFHRSAETLEQAIASAIENVRTTGLIVSRVEMQAEAVTGHAG